MKALPQHGRGSFGFTFVELLIVIGVVFIIAAVLLPTLGHTTAKKDRILCVNNLKGLGLTFRIAAEDEPVVSARRRLATNESSHPDLILEYARLFPIDGKSWNCGADNRWPVKRDQPLARTNISYFVGAHIASLEPVGMLAGDRNLSINGAPASPGLAWVGANDVVGWTKRMHNRQGNVLMGDGSVHNMTSAALAAHVRGLTNRPLGLVMP